MAPQSREGVVIVFFVMDLYLRIPTSGENSNKFSPGDKDGELWEYYSPSWSNETKTKSTPHAPRNEGNE